MARFPIRRRPRRTIPPRGTTPAEPAPLEDLPTVTGGRTPTRKINAMSDSGPGTAHPITIVGNPVLHHPCAPVEAFGDDLAALIDDMFASMYAAEGVGLAANQIAVPLRIFVYDCHDDDGAQHVGHVVNPTLVEL